MIKVIFCGHDEKGDYHKGADVTLHIPANSSIKEYIGQLIEFTVDHQYSDLPFTPRQESIIVTLDHQEFYGFKVEIENKLRILGKEKPINCLPPKGY